MRTLLHTLQDHDPGLLRIIAEYWAIDLPSLPPAQAAEALADAMLRPGAAPELFEGLPPAAQQVLQSLARHDRRIPWADLVRRFGELRDMGPGRRDRERPWREPVSPVEVLWYRGWIGRAFADTPAGPQEFGYVPQELAALIPAQQAAPAAAPGRQAAEPSRVWSAGGAAVDDSATLLAALRRRGSRSLPLPEPRLRSLESFLVQPRSAELLICLLHQMGLLRQSGFQPSPEPTRLFLEAPRSESLHALQQAWLGSETWNDLAHVGELAAPGDRWPNDPRLARSALVERLRLIPPGVWWDLQSLLEALYQAEPAFQRPGGDFDSWYLTERESGSYLQGFAAWWAIEGALLRHLLAGPLHWLGVIDLGTPGQRPEPDRFRLSEWGSRFFKAAAPLPPDDPPAAAALRPDGRLIVPAATPLGLRYQVARCCAWEARQADGYHYRLTPSGLRAGQEQGLQTGHVRAILEAAIGRKLPAQLLRAIERAGAAQVEARLEHPLVLRVETPATLRELQGSPGTARFLKKVLGPTAVQVDEGDWEKLCAAALRQGLLIEPPLDPA